MHGAYPLIQQIAMSDLQYIIAWGLKRRTSQVRVFAKSLNLLQHACVPTLWISDPSPFQQPGWPHTKCSHAGTIFIKSYFYKLVCGWPAHCEYTHPLPINCHYQNHKKNVCMWTHAARPTCLLIGLVCTFVVMSSSPPHITEWWHQRWVMQRSSSHDN